MLFDEFSEWRRSLGEKNFQVFQDEGDENKVSVLLEWDDTDKAKKFIAHSELSEIMQHAGVVDQPAIYLLHSEY
jgi:heme-degrading monooxygenase HmoA